MMARTNKLVNNVNNSMPEITASHVGTFPNEMIMDNQVEETNGYEGETYRLVDGSVGIGKYRG